LGAVGRLGFQIKWIWTILRISETCIAPACQILAHFGNAWLSYWLFREYFSPCWWGIL